MNAIKIAFGYKINSPNLSDTEKELFKKHNGVKGSLAGVRRAGQKLSVKSHSSRLRPDYRQCARAGKVGRGSVYLLEKLLKQLEQF
jgi:hypothetical protein